MLVLLAACCGGDVGVAVVAGKHHHYTCYYTSSNLCLAMYVYGLQDKGILFFFLFYIFSSLRDF